MGKDKDQTKDLSRSVIEQQRIEEQAGKIAQEILDAELARRLSREDARSQSAIINGQHTYIVPPPLRKQYAGGPLPGFRDVRNPYPPGPKEIYLEHFRGPLPPVQDAKLKDGPPPPHFQPPVVFQKDRFTRKEIGGPLPSFQDAKLTTPKHSLQSGPLPSFQDAKLNPEYNSRKYVSNVNPVIRHPLTSFNKNVQIHQPIIHY